MKINGDEEDINLHMPPNAEPINFPQQNGRAVRLNSLAQTAFKLSAE
jgi:hypothetical protein